MMNVSIRVWWLRITVCNAALSSSNIAFFTPEIRISVEKNNGFLKVRLKRQMDRRPKSSIPLATIYQHWHIKNACGITTTSIELLQNLADIILNPRPGISYSLKWNGFTFHKRNQFPRNYNPSLFADRMLKSHPILYSSGWTQFSSSIRPPQTLDYVEISLDAQSISF